MGNISSVVAFMRRALLRFSHQLKLYKAALTVKILHLCSEGVRRLYVFCVTFHCLMKVPIHLG